MRRGLALVELLVVIAALAAIPCPPFAPAEPAALGPSHRELLHAEG